jgi:AraC-like DNA-binding protein
MAVRRLPHPALRPFVRELWASGSQTPLRYAQTQCEYALPTGCVHLVFRLSDVPLHIVDSSGLQALGPAMVGGVRSRFYLRQMAAPSCSVGAVLLPGATLALFGVPADVFAERHAPLAAVWGNGADALHARLVEALDAEARLDCFESALLVHLAQSRSPHPGIARALASQAAFATVADAVAHSGLSHRHFIARFREAAGVAPKTWLRLRRFRHAVAALHGGRIPLAALAQASGYSDQAHFCREFVEFAGVSPSVYRRIMPASTHHLPVASEVKFLQYTRRPRTDNTAPLNLGDLQ